MGTVIAAGEAQITNFSSNILSGSTARPKHSSRMANVHCKAGNFNGSRAAGFRLKCGCQALNLEPARRLVPINQHHPSLQYPFSHYVGRFGNVSQNAKIELDFQKNSLAFFSGVGHSGIHKS
jgi:hypothetical protein